MINLTTNFVLRIAQKLHTLISILIVEVIDYTHNILIEISILCVLYYKVFIC